MNETNEAKTQWTFLSGLTDALRQQPAYALIFGLSALFFLFGIGSGFAAVVGKNPDLWHYAFGGLLASLVAAVIVVWRVQPVVPSAIPIPILSGDSTLDEVLYAIHQNVSKANKFNNETFRDAVLQACGNFLATTADWSEGKVVAHRYYNDLLLGFYERAKESVFSTSIPSYLSAWQGSLGEQMLDAHHRSRASITRVFLFNRRDEVGRDAVGVMEKQSKAGISVRLFFSDESKGQGFEFPTDISKDFTVIDRGEAIGVTLSFGGDNLAAEWYIKDEDRKIRFEGLCKSLLRASQTFPQFEEWVKRNKPVQP